MSSAAVYICSNKDVLIQLEIVCVRVYKLNFLFLLLMLVLFRLNFNGETAIGHLFLPFFNPGIWTDVVEHFLEIVAWLVVLST